MNDLLHSLAEEYDRYLFSHGAEGKSRGEILERIVLSETEKRWIEKQIQLRTTLFALNRAAGNIAVSPQGK